MTIRLPALRTCAWTTAAVLGLSFVPLAAQQGSPAAPQPSERATDMPGPTVWTSFGDHQHMMNQLGITALRPGPSGNESDPNHANYDEATANPYPHLPDPLVMENGQKVTSAEMWEKQRRPEIIELFEREVLGRIPANVPKVTWSVAETATGTLAGHPVVGKQLVGHVDNSSYPAIDVNIQLTLVTPADVSGPVPVMIIFRGGNVQQAVGNAPPPGRGGFGRGGQAGPGRGGAPAPPVNADPPATDQLIADGWGFAFLNPGSIQADNGAGLTRGIIGLVNKGQPRKPDDWGSLRAWSWGAARALDYFETDPAVDATKVGIDGVSRYGKAALVTMAFEPRFAVVLVGSSGEGGASLYRRNWGEAVENLTGTGEYHWMAGNFLKYGTAESTFGAMTPGDLPVDAHELIALCAPRPTFISYGVPERGDAKWLDHQGSYMAAVAAGPVFRLLGAKDLGTSDDYMTEKMPAVNVSMLDGQLAWRQHDGGHTDGPNWKYFIPWADRELGHTPRAAAQQGGRGGGRGGFNFGPADVAAPRVDENSHVAHEQLVAKAHAGGVDVYFEGDSIVRRWGALDYPEMLANFKQNFFGWNAGNFGWGADRTQNVLWRLQNGELDGVDPKVVVLLAGTNNVGGRPGPNPDAKVADVTRGVTAIVNLFREKTPDAVIILTAIFPRNIEVLPEIQRINANLEKLADGRAVRFLNINDKLADADGRLLPGMTVDGLHPSVQGYQVWADALKPMLTEILGPPAATDHAPPPTGNPEAK